jgi:hypothetical protein
MVHTLYEPGCQLADSLPHILIDRDIAWIIVIELAPTRNLSEHAGDLCQILASSDINCLRHNIESLRCPIL